MAPTSHLLPGFLYVFMKPGHSIMAVNANEFPNNKHFRMYYYSTTQTADAAYIIGGSYSLNVIAEYQNYHWSHLDDLNKGRYYHGSITIGTKTMIIGGTSRLVTVICVLT